MSYSLGERVEVGQEKGSKLLSLFLSLLNGSLSQQAHTFFIELRKIQLGGNIEYLRVGNLTKQESPLVFQLIFLTLCVSVCVEVSSFKTRLNYMFFKLALEIKMSSFEGTQAREQAHLSQSVQ
jgi:hypothetical protein